MTSLFNNIRNTALPKTQEPVIKAESVFYKGFLFGHISNGGGIIRLDDEYALKIISIDERSIMIQLLDYGKKLEMKSQSWQKTKVVKSKITAPVINKTKKEESLF